VVAMTRQPAGGGYDERWDSSIQRTFVDDEMKHGRKPAFSHALASTPRCGDLPSTSYILSACFLILVFYLISISLLPSHNRDSSHPLTLNYHRPVGDTLPDKSTLRPSFALFARLSSS
jgi:hypothetical protein